MMFEDFVNDIKAINEIVGDEDIKDIESHIGYIEKKLNKIGRKNKDKLYSLIGDAIKKIPLGYIADMTARENLGYTISTAVELFDDGCCHEDVYDCLVNNRIHVVTNGKGFVKLIEKDDLLESDHYKHVINRLAHNYELVLNNPNIPNVFKEPIRKIENLFKVFGIKEK